MAMLRGLKMSGGRTIGSLGVLIGPRPVAGWPVGSVPERAEAVKESAWSTVRPTIVCVAMPDYLAFARATQRFTFERLGYLGGAPDCERAPFLSYRCRDVEPEWSDQWYNATQLGADAALLAIDPTFGRCTIDKCAAFMARFRQPDGGYLARGRPDGSLVLRPDRYSDDNAHTGLMLLDAHEVTEDRRYRAAAERIADFLLGPALLDDTFGGGLWWNTHRGNSPEGKPAISQGLAIQLLARLFGATGRAELRTAALELDGWTDRNLFDPTGGLYRWSVSYADCAARRGRVVAERFFGYDQGIMIEAKLALHRHVAADPGYVLRAQEVAGQLEASFWHPGEGGFNLESGCEQVYAVYAAWLTPSLLALYPLDGDRRWLELARRNVDALNGYLRAPDGGYYRLARAQDGEWWVDRTRDTVANAAMQRAQALLARVGV